MESISFDKSLLPTPKPALKIVVVGGSGMLGSDLIAALEKDHNVIAPRSSECDISNWTSVERYFYRLRQADLIINCAAYTHVDKCETDSNRAFALNSQGPQILAKVSRRVKAVMMHVSTDYVFDGEEKSYTVDFDPHTQENKAKLSVYGRSKCLGEYYVGVTTPRHFIIRTSWLYGQNGPNFVKTISNLAQGDGPLKVVKDQFGCPTYTKDLVKAMVSLIGTEKYGVHHASGEGSCSWFEFAKRILEIKGIDKTVLPISTKKSFDLFPSIKAKRPANSVLVNTLAMRRWDTALEDYLKNDT